MGEERPSPGCGIDTVEVARIERLLEDHEGEELRRLFTAQELRDAGDKSGRAASLAARFAAKEACCKLFPKETALGSIGPADFGVRSDGYGAPQVDPSERGREVMNRYRMASISLSLTHTGGTASAVALAEWEEIRVPWYGAWFHKFLPWRREVVYENLRRVFGDVVPEEEITRIAKAYYGHYLKFLIEFLLLPFRSKKSRSKMVRIEGGDALLKAQARGKGVILLTGHFGNWEVATVVGIGQWEAYHGKFHFIRRPLKPAILDTFIRKRMQRSGLGTLSKKGSLDEVLEILEGNEFVIVVFDQHSTDRKAVAVDFFGHPAATMKSLAILAQSTGCPVVPASSWREPDGSHVLHFDEALDLVDTDDIGASIRKNTRSFNAALERIILRHPEQWIWMHKRWKRKHWQDR